MSSGGDLESLGEKSGRSNNTPIQSLQRIYLLSLYASLNRTKICLLDCMSKANLMYLDAERMQSIRRIVNLKQFQLNIRTETNIYSLRKYFIRNTYSSCSIPNKYAASEFCKFTKIQRKIPPSRIVTVVRW